MRVISYDVRESKEASELALCWSDFGRTGFP